MVNPDNIIPGTVVKIGLAFVGLDARRVADEHTGETGEVVDILEDGTYVVEIPGYGEVSFGSHLRFEHAWNPTCDPSVEDIFRDELEENLRRVMEGGDE
jgi:hypothetical protein